MRKLRNREKMDIWIYTALFMAIACVSTLVLMIPIPGGGYVNLGDGIVLLSAYLLGPVYGALAGALGTALADVMSGYSYYAPGTFVIKGVVAVTAYFVFAACRTRGIHSAVSGIAAGICGETLMVAGYFGYTALLLGQGLAAAASIPGNIGQAAAGIAISVVLYISLKKIPNKFGKDEK